MSGAGGAQHRVEEIIDRYQYLLLMAGCLLLTLPLEVFIGARVYRRPRRLVRTLVPVVLVFSLWDLVGIARDHWSYSPSFTTGWLLPLSIPVEELVFFVVIPICALLTYEAVGRVVDGAGELRRRRVHRRTA